MKREIKKECLNCGQEFTATRMDKKYCSDNCRQLAYFKRNGLTTYASTTALQAIPLSGDENEFYVKDVKPAQAEPVSKTPFSEQTDDYLDDEINMLRQQVESLKREVEQQEDEVEITQQTALEIELGILDRYVIPDPCLYKIIRRTGSSFLYSSQLSSNYWGMWNETDVSHILWVNKRFRCLVESLLKVNSMSYIDVDTFNAISSGVNKLIKSRTFNAVPDTYPFKEIALELPDWIRRIAMANYDPEKIRVWLPVEFKARLMDVRLSLLKATCSIKFSELNFEENPLFEILDAEEKRNKPSPIRAKHQHRRFSNH